MTEQIEMTGPSLELSLGRYAAAWRRSVERADDERWVERLFDRDASLWSADPRDQASIAGRLGWLDAPAHFGGQVAALEGFGEGIRAAGFTTAVVAGMGGSSLAPEVLWRTFGATPGWLDLRVLDSTDPQAVAAAVDDLDPLATLFIVATKSGATTETLAFEADAWRRIEHALGLAGAAGESPGQLLVAITDPEPSLAGIPHHDDLREVFLNPPDIGGRYAALTYVGLVPASLIGLDLDALIASAQAMVARCQAGDAASNPGVALGLALGMLAREGRDKVTLIADPEIAGFGAWVEQLLAESTGKRGIGIVPVDLEPLGAADAYGPDRAFVRLGLQGSAGPRTADGRAAGHLLAELAAAGHPVIRIGLPDPIDLGGEFVRWQIATAIAGIVLGVDPFDQPNVEESKERTRRLLAAAGGTEVPRTDMPAALAGASVPFVPAPAGEPLLATFEGITLLGDAPLRPGSPDGSAAAELRRHLARIRPSGYLAIQAYLHATPGRDEILARIRARLRDATRQPATLGYGPRFLHSTGQLHKGGPSTGWFLQITADHPYDRPIPGLPYTFGHLIDAQALGDLEALRAHGLPVLRVHLGADPDSGLLALERLVAEALTEA